MKNLLTVLLLSFLWLSSPSNANPEKKEVTIVDDGWVEVPLDFTFPFYGNNYVTSFMFSNGVIGFMNPNSIPGTGIVYDGLCCNSFDFTATNNNYGNHGGVRFDYVIMPWHTDLIDIGTGKFYIQGDDTFQSYFWENISEYYDNTDLNTFDATLYPTGNIRFAYQAVDIQSHSVTVAIVGDLSAGQYTQWFYNNPNTDGGVYWTSGNPLPVEIQAGQSICDVDSTASYVCTYYAEGYAEAIYAENCAANTLYDVGCPGYAAAYLTQQCSISTLYDSACPGYATAYYNQQCSISALYDTTCAGYETAYLDNQCSLDATYSPYCPGYAAEIAEEDTEEYWEEDYDVFDDYVETEEYEDIYYDYSTFDLEPLIEEFPDFEIFDSDDFLLDTNTYTGGFELEIEDYSVTIEDVFTEIEAEMMEEFEDFTLFEDSSMLNDIPEIVLEDFAVIEDIPDIEELPMEDFPETVEDLETEISEDVELSEPENLTEEIPEEEPREEIELEPEPETEEELTEEIEETTEEESEENEEINEPVEEEEEESEGSADEENIEESEKEEEREETMVAETEPEEEIVESKIKEPTETQKKKSKEQKLREIITAKLKSLAVDMGEAASIEAQQEIQNFIIALLNFNLGFNSYNSAMVDGTFYQSKDIYLNLKVPENQRGLRNGLANEILHNKLVDIQYGEEYGRSRIQRN